jgi:hypothetical protein
MSLHDDPFKGVPLPVFDLFSQKRLIGRDVDILPPVLDVGSGALWLCIIWTGTLVAYKCGAFVHHGLFGVECLIGLQPTAIATGKC